MRWQSIAGFSIGSVMACGWFISTARWTYSLFLQFSPWRNPRLTHFAGYPFGASRKKHQPFSMARPSDLWRIAVFSSLRSTIRIAPFHILIWKCLTGRAVSIRETAPHRPGKRLYGALFYCWNNPLETQIPQNEASGAPTKKRCARQRLPAFAGVSSLALSLPVLAASEGKHTKNPLFQHDKKYAFGGGQP